MNGFLLIKILSFTFPAAGKGKNKCLYKAEVVSLALLSLLLLTGLLLLVFLCECVKEHDLISIYTSRLFLFFLKKPKPKSSSTAGSFSTADQTLLVSAGLGSVFRDRIENRLAPFRGNQITFEEYFFLVVLTSDTWSSRSREAEAVLLQNRLNKLTEDNQRLQTSYHNLTEEMDQLQTRCGELARTFNT